MAIPAIDGLKPDDIKEPILVPDGTRVTIKITKEPQILCSKDDGEDTKRQYMLVFGNVIKAPKKEYMEGNSYAQHMVIIPSNHWLVHHTDKDGPEKANALFIGYKQKYAKWLRQTIAQPANKADTTLYTGLDLDIIIGLEESDEYGDKNTIKRILD
jgi:hypothetical protein